MEFNVFIFILLFIISCHQLGFINTQSSNNRFRKLDRASSINRVGKYYGVIVFNNYEDREPLLPVPTFSTHTSSSKRPSPVIQTAFPSTQAPIPRTEVKSTIPLAEKNTITATSVILSSTTSSPSLQTSSISSTVNTVQNQTMIVTATAASNTAAAEESFLEGHYYVPFQKMGRRPTNRNHYYVQRRPYFQNYG